VRLNDLIKPKGTKIDSGMTSESVKKMLDDAARFQKSKAWTKLSDRYAKKEE